MNTWDNANGNLTSDGANSYIWDARGHLVALAGSNVAAYQCDALGRRVQNTMNGAMTQYLYDGMNPVEELDGSSPANVTATMLTGLGIDQYFARTDSNGTMSYLTNRLGSTLALANSSGTITTQYTYDPFGNTTVTGSSTNPFQFTGRENDGTGLYYYRARYYSPTLGRFISQDPLGFAGSGPNLYVYVDNMPTQTIDPLGKDPFTGAAIGAFIGGLSAFQTAEANGGQNLVLSVVLGSAAGASAGAVTGFVSPADIIAGAAAGAAGAFVANLLAQSTSNRCGGINIGSAIGAGAGGALVGAAGSALAGEEAAAELGPGLVKGTITGVLGPPVNTLGGVIGGHL